MAVFWIATPSSLAEVYQRFRGASIIRAMMEDNDGGSKYLRNVDKLPPDYTAQQPKRQPYSYSKSQTHYPSNKPAQ
jgi:hypothetical protein